MDPCGEASLACFLTIYGVDSHQASEGKTRGCCVVPMRDLRVVEDVFCTGHSFPVL